ncbi:MAG: fatty acid desaturase [Rhodospirillales bacterium]
MIVLYGYIIYWIVAAVGITYGYHRYFAHNDYKTNKYFEVVLLYLGLLCGGRSALTWSGVHRIHHANADTDKDPHSPKNHPWYVVLFSLWRVKQIPRRYMTDLLDNPRVMFFHKYGKYVLAAHWIVTTLLFGVNAIIINAMLIILSYMGFGILNFYGHDAKGPANNFLINLIAPFEGNHKDHHEYSKI